MASTAAHEGIKQGCGRSARVCEAGVEALMMGPGGAGGSGGHE